MTKETERAGGSGDAKRPDEEKEALGKKINELLEANRRLESNLTSLRRKNLELEKHSIGLAAANESLEQENERLQLLGLYDSQTRLGNRDLFFRQLEHLIAIADRRNEEVALLELDLDGFKAVNDRLGHAAGDEVLREIGVRLGRTLRKADQKFRIGGDEFAVLLEPRAHAFDGALVVAEQIAERLVKPIVIGGSSCSIGVSIGIAVFPTHGREPEALLRKADAAMYEAKRNRLVVSGATDLGATTVLKSLQSQLFQLIYVSTATRPITKRELVNLLLENGTRNDRLQLTGMLLYKDGRFMEVLEGDELNVRKVFAEIEQEERHKSIDVLRSERIPHRNFPGWTMSFEQFDPSALPCFTDFLEQDQSPHFFSEEAVEAHAILLAFKRADLVEPFGPAAVRRTPEEPEPSS